MTRAKKLIWFFLTFIIAIGMMTGCSCSRKSGQEPDGAEFQAYYQPLSSEDIETEGDIYYASSRLLLTATSDASYSDIKTLTADLDGEIIGYISATNDYEIYFPDGKTYGDLEQLVRDLKEEVLVEDASLTYVAQYESDAVDYKNDPWIDDEHPSDTSGSVWNVDDPDGNNWWAEAINMPVVWDMDMDLQTVKVGIFDTMFDLTHKDFAEDVFVKTWNNPDNVADLYKNAVSNNDMDAVKKAAHGTHVAGIICALANESGITGINQNVQMYGYACSSTEAAASDEGQWGDIFQFKCAFAHLLNEDVKVINCSIGLESLVGTQDGDSYWTTFTSVNSKSLESFLLKYIESGKEFLIVKSAGNDSTTKKKYDASNDLFGAISNEAVKKRIIIVGAAKNSVSGNYTIAEDSVIGSRVDVYAPGVDILSDMPANGTALKGGTSVAAPIVTGLASLIWGINPDFRAEQVRWIIKASTGPAITELDTHQFLMKEFYNIEPTTIVNAKVCVQLAQDLIGDANSAETDHAAIMGMIYALTPDEAGFEELTIQSVSLYDEDGTLVLVIPVDDIDVSNDRMKNVILQSYNVLVNPGTYTLEVKAEGYITQEQSVTVVSGDVIQLDFELEPEFDLEVYAEILREKEKELIYPQFASFALAYIDEDEIPELIINSNICHINWADVYTFKHGEIVYNEVYAPFGTLRFSPGNGIIQANEMNLGCHVDTIQKFADGEINTLAIFTKNEFAANGETEYFIDRNEVSKAAYDSQLAEWEEKYSYVTFYYDYNFAITEDNINLMLEDPVQVTLK